MKTFAIHTFGCKVNAYESQSLRERLLRQGFAPAGKETAPDVVFVNTCAVTSEAERKDRQRIRNIRRKFPDAVIVVMGCSSQIHPEYYLENCDHVFGTSQKSQVESCLGLSTNDHVVRENRNLSYDDTPIRHGEHEERAYVKVQDGCDNFCAYCLVPFARGNSRSRTKDSVLQECAALIEDGVKEIVIGGIDTGSYASPDREGYALASLLEGIVSLQGDFRVRVSSLEASQIDDRLIDVFARNTKKLCPHFHIPLQSGSDRVLRLMNRKYGVDFFRRQVERIRTVLGNCAFSTDVITGFPGETEEDFCSTYDLLEDLLFMRIHAFPYSERPLTRALSLPDKVPVALRQERTRRLLLLSEENEARYRKSLRGTRSRVLIEKKEREGIYSGYTESYLIVSVPSTTDIRGCFQDIEWN